MIAIDFFCGAGGMTCGLRRAGIKVALGIDVNERFRESYERNNKSSQFLRADIRQLKASRLRRFLKEHDRNDLLLSGCAPCQPFSQHQRAAERYSDGTLLGSFARFVEQLRPAQVLIENVPGITRVSGFSTYRRFIKLLDELEYYHDEGVLDAKYHGVPQNRRRFVLLAMRGLECSLPRRTHGPGRKPFVTVKDAIAGYPALKVGEENRSIANHVAGNLSKINRERLKHTPTNGGDRRAWPKRLQLECHKGDYDGHTDV